MSAVGRPISSEELTPEKWREEMIAGANALSGEVNVPAIDYLRPGLDPSNSNALQGDRGAWCMVPGT